jgi:outer membrane biosynthesis protein TonB
MSLPKSNVEMLRGAYDTSRNFRSAGLYFYGTVNDSAKQSIRKYVNENAPASSINYCYVFGQDRLLPLNVDNNESPVSLPPADFEKYQKRLTDGDRTHPLEELARSIFPDCPPVWCRIINTVNYAELRININYPGGVFRPVTLVCLDPGFTFSIYTKTVDQRSESYGSVIEMGPHVYRYPERKSKRGFISFQLAYHTSNYSNGLNPSGIPFDPDQPGEGQICLVFYHWSSNDENKSVKKFVADHPLIEANTTVANGTPVPKKSNGEVFDEVHTDSDDEDFEEIVEFEGLNTDDEEVKVERKRKASSDEEESTDDEVPIKKKASKPKKEQKKKKQKIEEKEKEKKKKRPVIPKKEKEDTNGKLVFTKTESKQTNMIQTTLPTKLKSGKNPIDFTDKKRKHYGVWFDEAKLSTNKEARAEIDTAITDLLSTLDLMFSSTTLVRHGQCDYDMYKDEDGDKITAVMVSPPCKTPLGHTDVVSMIIVSNKAQDLVAIENFCKSVPFKTKDGWGILRGPTKSKE